ncbi:DMT family transporter [Phyllobacterium leguminum]|uniref:Drug/metabolite transporter (DMT)-like permease n=1 Tax=Phyllobacterium leguminum TaxID=314237 RepID=A0A318T166_9HYPH|nr:DMT family transporter [Phyllobacterium leguminum]PYE88227.1 drug/metabolite transporter (DMT)-like permease [Phyllobacterium leguminum]
MINYSTSRGPPDGLAYLAAATAVFLWASAFVGIRYLLQYFTPFGIATLRFLIASFALSLCFAFMPRAAENPMLKSDWAMFALFGLLGIVGYNAGINIGEKTVSAGTASFIVAQVPIATTVLQAVIFRTKLNTVLISGLLLGVLGTTIVFLGESGSIGLGLGVIWILLGVISESAYFVLQRPAVDRMGSFRVNYFTIVAATLIMLPTLPWRGQADVQPDWFSWSVVAYLGLFPSALAYFLWSFSIGRVGAVTTSSTLYALPIVTTLLGYFVLHETPSFISITGGAIALIGAIIVHSCNNKS